jgi:phenylalanyl-tRNA synthetase alpha chain
MGMGYSIMDGPEIEQDEFCFQRLNVPSDHPARDMQDTIYIKEPEFLLRTQTSSIESRTLANCKPPFKIVSPGRVYRNESVNKSNHFVFHHYQGVVVAEKTNLKDLFGTFDVLFKKMYGENVITRYRNKYYPEVEPGVGPDMQCFNCHGKGCALCKGVGWIEMGGAGIIHPNVMKMAGIDNKKWTGFAFGLGLDRWVMAKYKITDIRTLLGGNLGYKYYENESII